jgi:DNA-binding transcriptional MerR regulator
MIGAVDPRALEVTVDDRKLDGRGLYGISVTAELTGVNAQNLRVYEARGLLEPERTSGGTRRYSDHDLERIERIVVLLDAGLNLKGVGYVLELEAETRRLRRELDDLRGVQRSTGP